MDEKVMAELRRTFKPEFLNRVDDTVVFRRLDRDDIAVIAGRMLEIVKKRFEGLGYKLEVTPEAKSILTAEGYDEKYGARPLRRAIQTDIEDAAAELLLSGAAVPGDTLLAAADKGKIVLTKG